MEYLYVCHFSNGHIKVGRSISPESRIATHADRVACLGIELIEHHIVECAGYSISAESALIERCTRTATKRNKSEWFEGLDFIDACEWANQSAAITNTERMVLVPQTGIQKAVSMFEDSPTKLAAAVGNGVLRQHIEHWLSSGRVSAERCPEVSAATGIPIEDLNDKVNWALVRGDATTKAVA